MKVITMNDVTIIEAAEILLGALNEANLSLPLNDNEFDAYSISDKTKNDVTQILIRSWKEAGSSHGPSVKVGKVGTTDKSISISIKTGKVPKKEAEDTRKMRRLSKKIAVGEQFVRCEQALLIAFWNCNNDDEALQALGDIAKDRLKKNKYIKKGVSWLYRELLFILIK